MGSQAIVNRVYYDLNGTLSHMVLFPAEIEFKRSCLGAARDHNTPWIHLHVYRSTVVDLHDVFLG